MSFLTTMSRRDFLAAAALLATQPAFAAVKRPAAVRFVSMNVLQQALQGRYEHETCTPEALLHLAGLADIEGFVLDRRNGDIAVFGPVETPLREPLHTGDWVHALRSATHRYLDDERRFEHPGVSLDMQQPVVERLMRFDASGLNGDAEAARRATRQWAGICESPQVVRPTGLQREGRASRYLASILEADANMKSIVDGTINMPRVVVPTRVMLERERAAFEKGGAIRRAGFSFSRYWYTAGEVACGINGDACLLLECQVKVLTNAQMIAKKGIVDSDDRDELADRCAASYSSVLPQLRFADLIHCRLYQVYRLQALAVAAARLRVEQRAGLDLGFLLDRWKMPQFHVDATLPGRWSVQGEDLRAQRAGGMSILKVRIPSCGGVVVNPDPGEFAWPLGKRVAEAALKARNAQGKRPPLYWDMVLQPGALGRG